MRTTLLFSLVAIAGCSQGAPSAKIDEKPNEGGNEMTDWILVKKGTPELIKAAITSHTEVYEPQKPGTFAVRITPLDSGGHAVDFDNDPPPYDFANLIGWLNAPPETEGVSDAVGWCTSRSTGRRYYLRPDHDNPAGDTLVGAAKDGQSISVYLPELSVCEISSPVEYVSDNEFVRSAAGVVSFSIVLDVDESFGNPNFELTHEKDAQW